MKLFPLNQTGSALVLGVMAGLVGVMGSVGAALLLKSYLRQNSQTGQAVQASGSDLVGLDYLSGKFKFKKSGDGSRVIGKPSWFIDPYPSAQTLIQSSVQPGPGIIKIPGRVVAFDVASATQELVPKWSIPGVKKGMKCLPLDKPEISFAKKLPTEACAPDKNHPILEYVIDEGNLDSVEKNSGTTAFVNTKNLMKMSQDKTVLKSLLNGGGVPVQVESMAAGAVQFRALHAHKRYPQALGTVEVQMGNTIAEIPVELPPNPKCQIRLLSPIPRQVGIDPSFEPGTDVLFALSTDSIALSAQSSADGGVHIQTVNVSSQQSVGNFGRFQQIATFSLKAPDRPLPILRRSDTTVAWFPKVFVQGVTGNATSNCTLEVPVHAPPPPICTLSPENAQILRGQSTNMILDCTNPNGGAVVSATIAGQAVPANFPITKKAQLPYTRTEVRNKEKIVAVVQGILDTIEVVAWLGEVCPFNDPNYSAQLLKARQWLNIRNIVTEEKDLVTPFKNADPLFFTRSPTAKVVSMSSLEVPLEFITEGVSLTKDPGLKRFGIEPRGGGINCRWTVEFDPTNANLTRYNLEMNAYAQLNRTSTVLNSGGRRSPFRLPSNTAVNQYRELSRLYDLQVSKETGKVVVTEQVRYQKLKKENQTVQLGNTSRTVSVWVEDGDPLINTQDFWVWGSAKNPNMPETRSLVLSGTGEVYLWSSLGIRQLLIGAKRGCSDPPNERYYAGSETVFNTGNLALGEMDRSSGSCKPNRFCMYTGQYQRATLPTGDQHRINPGWTYQNQTYDYALDVIYGGEGYWVEVGPATEKTCSIQRARLRQGGCFSADTPILMADGSQKKVSLIAENDYVYNPHYQTGVRVKSLVKGPEKKSLFEVWLGTQQVKVTEDHPFFTNRGWLQAQELKEGDVLLGEGSGKLVQQVRKLSYEGPQDVWNFELDTEDPLAHLVVANGIPTGDLTTQLKLKKQRALP